MKDNSNIYFAGQISGVEGYVESAASGLMVAYSILNRLQGKKITFHDPCYLGRANGEYEAPRMLLEKLDAELVEMKRCKSNGLCCGAGGAQMFKEPEKGNKDINVERTEEALSETPQIIATGCPFCNTMMTDGVKHFNKNDEVAVKDIVELLAEAEDV